MKIKADDELSPLLKYTQGLAKKIAKDHCEEIKELIVKLIKKDEKFNELNYSGLMTFINTIGQHIFCYLFTYSNYLGKQFPDVSHSSRNNFEEIISGFRLLLEMPEIDKKEYLPDIKKIHMKANNN